MEARCEGVALLEAWLLEAGSCSRALALVEALLLEAGSCSRAVAREGRGLLRAAKCLVGREHTAPACAGRYRSTYPRRLQPGII